MGLGVGIRAAVEIGKRVVTSGVAATRFSSGGIAAAASAGGTAARTAATRAFAQLPAASQTALINTGYAAGGLTAGAGAATLLRRA